MGVDQPECHSAGLAGPAKKIEHAHWHKTKRRCRSLGCGLQFGGAENDLYAIGLQSSNTLFSAARTSNSRWRCLVLSSEGAMRVSFYFERGCSEQRPRAALKPQEPHSSGPWTPGGPPPRSSRVVESWSCVESWSRGKHFTPEACPLSHNANPRDGAQDIAAGVTQDRNLVLSATTRPTQVLI
jgi:hypothetical protein